MGGGKQMIQRLINWKVNFFIVSVCFVIIIAGCGKASTVGKNSEEGAKSSAQTTIRIGTVTWIGYSGLWLAQDLGYFEEENLKVDYSTIDDTSQLKSAFASNKIDGMASTIDSIPKHVSEGIPLKIVFALDHSNGADGIVALKNIKSVKDLKGKDVGVEIGSVSEWFLANILKENGLSLDDLNIKEMTSSDAGAAFVAKKIDAAVTWEPWLSNAQKSGYGKVLISSKELPDLIVDVFGFSEDFINKNPDAVKAFIRAYDKGVQYLNENPEEAYKIIAKRINGTTEDVKKQLEGLKIMTVSDSKKFFGTPDQPGRGYELAEIAANFWYENGVLKDKVDESKIKESIDSSFLTNY